jgi:hypothetical protein
MTFGLQCDEPTPVAILDRASEGGMDFIDIPMVRSRRRVGARQPGDNVADHRSEPPDQLDASLAALISRSTTT